MVAEESKGASPVRGAILVGGLWLFHVLLNAAWLHLDNYPPSWDSAHHLSTTLRWLAFWQSPSLANLQVAAGNSSYPPLTYCLVIPFYLLFGREPDVAILGNGALWLAVLLAATYGLGRQIRGTRTGLLAAAIVSSYPLIVALQRDFLLDLALTASVALALYLLIRCGTFDEPRWALLLGLTLGAGSLIKWPFLAFLAGPFLASLYQVARRGGWSRARVVNLVLCLFAAGSLLAIQFLFNLLFLPEGLYNLSFVGQKLASFWTVAGHPAWNTLPGLLYYAVALVNHQATLLFAVLFLVALPAFLRNAERGRAALLLSIGVPLVVATWLPMKEQRMTVPYLPSIAVITAVGLGSIRRPALRTGLIILVLGAGLLQLWAASFGLPALPENVYVRSPWAELALFEQHPVQSPRDFQAQPGDWQHRKLVEAIRADGARLSVTRPIGVPVIASTAACNPNTLNYYSLLDGAGIAFLYVWGWYNESGPLDLSRYPYLVVKTGNNAEVEGKDRDGVRLGEAFLSEHRAEFDLIYQAHLPDGSEMQVYRRHPGYQTGS